MQFEYRLSWESADPFQAAHAERTHPLGKDCWTVLYPWDEFEFHAVSRIGMDDIHGQHNQLKRWAETHEQAIRNVTFERREVPEPQVGWELVP